MPGGQRQAINLEGYAKFFMVSQVPWTYFMRNWPRGQSQESVWNVIGRDESHGEGLRRTGDTPEHRP